MKINYSLLFLLLLLGISAGVHGQENTKRTRPKVISYYTDLLLPIRDTVIICGEEIEVGSYFHKNWQVSVEVIGFGKSKESDLEKGFYIIKQKPKQNITYQLAIQCLNDKAKLVFHRTVYVAKNEEEKKQIEQRLKEKFEAEKKRIEKVGKTRYIDMSQTGKF